MLRCFDFSIAVLIAVFVLIITRRIGKIRLQIWQIMLGGAAAVILSGSISPENAFKSINADVMLFLTGMFVIGEALHKSGYLTHLSYHLFRRARSVDGLVLMVLYSMGLLSAFLMNDTLAVIGPPLMLFFADNHRINPRLLLLALAYAITIGSVCSPIGNPQNLLVALGGGIGNPFLTFFRYLLLPYLINLFITYLILKLFYREHFHDQTLRHMREPIKDKNLARLSRLSLLAVVALVGIKIMGFFLGSNWNFSLTHIALISAAPLLLFSRRRFQILKNIDWATLTFFAAMFVLMAAVWGSGFFQGIIVLLKITLSSPAMILSLSVVISQFISNVPFVALFLPLLQHINAGATSMMALAAGSTIAGNLTLIGAASNVIILQGAEKRGQSISFWEFFRIGLPLTIVNLLVYWFFLVVV